MTDTTGPLVRVVETCIACPSQWDAWTADGTRLYMRYRFGRGRVEIGDGLSLHAQVVSTFEHGDGLSGCMSLPEFLQRAGLQLAEGAEVLQMSLD